MKKKIICLSGLILVTFNTNMSICNGNTVVGWDNEEWGLELSNIDRGNTECFLYFDK